VFVNDMPDYIISADDYPELSRCSRQIRANLVAVNATWKWQAKQMDRMLSNKEKSIVYGARRDVATRYVFGECCRLRLDMTNFVLGILMAISAIGVVNWLCWADHQMYENDIVLD